MAQLEADIPLAFFALSIVRSLNGSAPGEWITRKPQNPLAFHVASENEKE